MLKVGAKSQDPGVCVIFLKVGELSSIPIEEKKQIYCIYLYKYFKLHPGNYGFTNYHYDTNENLSKNFERFSFNFQFSIHRKGVDRLRLLWEFQ